MGKSLLIIWDSMTGGSHALAQAVAAGAESEAGLDTRLLHADDVQPGDMLGADAFIFVFPENLAAISGVMKAAFDRLYYPCLGRIEGRAYAAIICAGSDGTNALRQAERIATGWRLKQVAKSQIVLTHAQTPEAILAQKVLGASDVSAAQDLGKAMAAGIVLGVF